MGSEGLEEVIFLTKNPKLRGGGRVEGGGGGRVNGFFTKDPNLKKNFLGGGGGEGEMGGAR